MPHFMLFFHERPADALASTPDEATAAIEDYKRWAESVAAKGKMRGGEKLTNDGGRHLRVEDDEVTEGEGPFAETADAITGVFVIEADDYDEAVALSRTCPHLKGRQWIEVRRLESA
ncbi:YciI family protein [Inquilinus sp. CAU 1745]|uniref:YciI family protein n=1 Tax=Inquilinus sp. CAU 1745 TaxID=3140369 RepID=UPI00325A6D68